MYRYIARRLILYIPTLIAVSIVIFVVMRVVPGDPAFIILGGGFDEASGVSEAQVEAVRERMGFNRPLYVQYFSWIWDFVRLEWGTSIRFSSPVREEIFNRLPLTLELAGLAVIFAVVTGIPLGLLSAMRQDTWIDYSARVFSVLGLAVPNFWLAMLIILALSVWVNWLPPLGYARLTEAPWQNLQQMFWPMVVLGYSFAAYIARMTRSQMLEVLRQDYVRTATAKGLRRGTVVTRHALRNALLPVVTLSGLQLSALVGGSLIVEMIFGLPGIGRLLLIAINFRDYSLMQALILLMASTYLTVNLVIDLMYVWLDPRIKYE